MYKKVTFSRNEILTIKLHMIIIFRSLNNYLMWSLVIKFGHEADGELLQHLLDTTTNGMSKEEYCANVTIEYEI